MFDILLINNPFILFLNLFIPSLNNLFISFLSLFIPLHNKLFTSFLKLFISLIEVKNIHWKRQLKEQRTQNRTKSRTTYDVKKKTFIVSLTLFK